MTDLEKLAARCEAATAEQQSWMLKDAGNAVFGYGSDAELMRRFFRHISNGAYLDAAMTLVPEGLVWSLNTFGNPAKANAYVMDEQGEQWRCEGYPATPALALTAAALRAHQQGEGR